MSCSHLYRLRVFRILFNEQNIPFSGSINMSFMRDLLQYIRIGLLIFVPSTIHTADDIFMKPQVTKHLSAATIERYFVFRILCYITVPS